MVCVHVCEGVNVCVYGVCVHMCAGVSEYKVYVCVLCAYV